MKRLLHKALMKIIPWKLWGWSATRRLMQVNHWSNRKEFERLLIENAESRKNWGKD